MNDFEANLNKLAEAARDEPAPDIDIRSRVMHTVAAYQQPVTRLDLLPIAFSGVAVTVAASLVFVCLPSLQMILDPWASYFTQ